MLVLEYLKRSIKELKYSIDLVQYLLMSCKQSIICIYFCRRFVEISCTYKAITICFPILFSLYNPNFAMHLKPSYAKNRINPFSLKLLRIVDIGCLIKTCLQFYLNGYFLTIFYSIDQRVNHL